MEYTNVLVGFYGKTKPLYSKELPNGTQNDHDRINVKVDEEVELIIKTKNGTFKVKNLTLWKNKSKAGNTYYKTHFKGDDTTLAGFGWEKVDGEPTSQEVADQVPF